jgi:hypothetical protein
LRHGNAIYEDLQNRFCLGDAGFAPCFQASGLKTAHGCPQTSAQIILIGSKK